MLDVSFSNHWSFFNRSFGVWETERGQMVKGERKLKGEWEEKKVEKTGTQYAGFLCTISPSAGFFLTRHHSGLSSC